MIHTTVSIRIMPCRSVHFPTWLTHETLQQMPSIKKNEWQRRRFFTFCSLIDVFWPLPHTVEKKCVCLLFSLILYHHSVTMFKYWQILPQKSSSKSLNHFLLPYCCWYFFLKYMNFKTFSLHSFTIQ